MMMLGERMLTHNNQNYPIPAIQIPIGYDEEEYDDDWDLLVMDAYSCDDFRMFEFKVRLCARGRSHDWTECPYAHPGEKARRRDPRKYRYSGTACPEFRKGSCKRGDGCEFAHGVFECWLHPTRYRTQPCKDGVGCRRRVCFFAHTPEQLRVLTAVGGGSEGVESYDGSPLRVKQRGVVLSPTSTLVGFGGCPVSPNRSESYGSPPISPTVEEVMMGFRKMGISRSPAMTGSSWIREMEAFDFGRRNTISGSGDDRYRTLMKEKLGLEDIVDEPDWFSDLMN